MRRLPLATVLVLEAACQAHGTALRAPGPLLRDGEVYVYLRRAAQETVGLAVESVAAVRPGGGVEPLALAASEFPAGAPRSQRLLAWGRLAPGTYAGLAVKLSRAALARDGGSVDLRVPSEALRVEGAFAISARKATVLNLWVPPGAPASAGAPFEPALALAPSRPPVAQASGYCSSSALDGVTVFDQHAREVVGVLPTGRGPEGMALDTSRGRLYVALSGEDQIAVLDVNTGDEVGRAWLRPGDAPRDVGLTPDGRLLLAVNRGTASLAFVDPGSLLETGRVATGDRPGDLLVDRQGQRAYVVNQGAASVTVVDVPARAVAATLRTEAQPVRIQLSRAGDRLYVAHAASPVLLAFQVPGFQLARRTTVGPGASALRLDARTDLLYLGHRDRDRLEVYDPLAVMPVSQIETPGPVSRIAIGDAEGVFFALVPERGALAAIDPVSGRTLAVLDVGSDPYQVLVAGERR